MATAKREGEPRYILEMTEYEASVLLKLLSHVGGDPKGPRGAADRIAWALEKVVVENDIFDVDGNIMIS